MKIASDSQSYLKELAVAVHSGSINRRAFIKIAFKIGLTATAVFEILYPTGMVTAGQADHKSLLKQVQQELESAEREFETAIKEYNARVEEMEAEEEDAGFLNDQENENVFIQLKYPVGKSPKVFQTGWAFGAECLLRPKNDDNDPIDASEDIEWSGTGNFSPAKGRKSHPSFNSPGINTIVLSTNYEGSKITKTIKIDVVSTSGYATVGSIAKCDSDAHGCPGCPHAVVGPVMQGSPNVLINGKPAARLGDVGIHSACCGPGTFKIAEGDPNVLINGKPAAKKGCKTIHCGGTGSLISK